MNKEDKIKIADQPENVETIIRQHRRGTHWLEYGQTVGEGSLILTNRRLLFLHLIEANASVAASIKELAEAPIAEVLDHALSLHKYSFQIPLSAIIQARIGFFFRSLFPQFCLTIVYLKGKSPRPHTVDFQFKRSSLEATSRPQVMIDRDWKKSIHQAIIESD